MQRDMNPIRLLLLRAEGEEEVDFASYTEEQRIYHRALLVEAGLVDGAIRTDAQGYPNGVAIIRLTWKGHEFWTPLGTILCGRGIGTVRSKGLSLTFDVLKELLTATIRGQVGL